VGYGLDKEVVVNGVSFTQPMAGIEALNPTQIANVGNYVYEKWSGTDKKFTPKEIETALANCK
jgi:mono/diheme cytochrome c family protein